MRKELETAMRRAFDTPDPMMDGYLSLQEEIDKDYKEYRSRTRYWVVPMDVRNLLVEGKITIREFLLLGEIDGLVRNGSTGKGCFASNKKLAEMVGVSEPTTIARMISKLKKMGLVIQTGFDGRKRYLETCWSKPLKDMRKE